MLSQCFLPPKSTEKILRPTSTARHISVTSNESTGKEETINYVAAYKLQENNVRLQDGTRSAIKELVKILSRTSNDMKTWQGNQYKFFVDNHDNLTPYENIWSIFFATISATDGYIEQMDNSIEKLKHARNSIPIQDKNELLKVKILQARSLADNLSADIDTLEKKNANLAKQIRRLKSSNTSTTTDSQTYLYNLEQKEAQRLNSIKEKKKIHQNYMTAFYRKAATIIKQNEKDEIERVRLIKQRLSDVVQSLNIECTEFHRVLRDYNPEKDHSEWDQKVLRKSVQQSPKTSPIEGESYDTRSHTRQQSQRSPLVEDETYVDKKYVRQQSRKAPAVENKHRDDKNYTGKSSSDKSENYDNKKSTTQESFEFSAVHDSED